MSTTLPARPNKPWLKTWLDFWFAPGDPTTLGFLRLVTGFIVLYVHLAYCFDFHSFFGPHAWWGLNEANRERREAPTPVPTFWDDKSGGWDETPKSAFLPEYPHRLAAFLKFLRGLPADDKAQFAQSLKFLTRIKDAVENSGNPMYGLEGFGYVAGLSGDPNTRAKELQNMVKGDTKFVTSTGQIVRVPVLLTSLPEDSPTSPQRREVAAEIEAFFRVLPADADERKYVIAHFVEADAGRLKNLVRFIKELGDLTPEQRQELIEYMEYWNFEKKQALRVGQPTFSVWFHMTDPTIMAVAHGVVLVVMFCFAVGFCTRVTSALTWVAAVGYIHRNQYVLFGMDTMMNILLIYLMIGNSGAALSVDRLIARYRAGKLGLGRSGTLDDRTRAYLETPPKSVSAGFALKLLNVHFCFIYMAAGLSKLKGNAWWNTTAYWDTLVNPEFTLIHYSLYESFVRNMVGQRPFYALASALGVGFTFVAEIGLPFLIWTRLRPFVMIMGFMLHAGVAIFMGLWIFSLLMMMMLLGYMPGWCVRERIFGAKPAATPFTVTFSKADPVQVRAAARIAALDFDAQATFAEGSEYRVVVDGKPFAGTDAAKAAAGRMAWASPVRVALLVPGLSGVVAGMLAPQK
jgi:hypothetical protein